MINNLREAMRPEFRINILLLLLSAALFIILYAILSFHNRMPYEDYFFFSLLKNTAPVDVMITMYKEYCARWSAYSLGLYLAFLYEKKFFLPLFHVSTLITLFISFLFLVKKLFVLFSPKRTGNIKMMFCTLFFTLCFFFSSYDIGQVWFWYVVNWMYMWSIIAGNFLFLLLLSKKLKIIHLLFIIILTAYIAGASESYSMIYIFFLTFLLILKKKTVSQSISNILNRISIKWLVVTLIFLSSFYMITVFAPGTWVRKNILTHANFIEHIIMVMKAYGKIVLLQTPKLVPYLILFGLPWMMFGQEFSSGIKIGIKKLSSLFVKSILIVGLLVFILILPASWILYDIPPARALSQVSLLLSIYASCFFFYIGYKISIPEKISQAIIFFALILSVIVLSFHAVNQYYITSNFSKEYDKRIELLTKENNSGRKNTVFLEPLPASGMIYSDELSSDSTSNGSFEKTYNLKFHVAVKKEE